MFVSKRLWYLPSRVSCLDVDDETREALRSIARGRTLLIDYFACAARWASASGIFNSAGWMNANRCQTACCC